MERTKKSTRKKVSASWDDKIGNAYREHILSEGKPPVSVYKFCLDHGIPEEEFYNVFGSFEGIDQHFWNRFLERTIARLQNDETYGSFTTSEKALAFYFTFVEELKSDRSLVVFYLKKPMRLELIPSFLRPFKKTFEAFVSAGVEEGKTSQEIASRPFFDKQYPQLFWIHLGFILHFWKDDTSAAFENTDAVIEKSVNLIFDLIGKGAVDSMLDFGKFLYQTKVAG